MDSPKKIPINEGLVARLVRGVSYMISGGTTAWMSPGQPSLPQVQQEQGRQWDYPVAINIPSQPRYSENITFAELRALADSYDLLRLVIETRKDQMAKLSWAIKPRDSAVASDARCDEMMLFFRYPDKEHDWQAWLRMLIEDVLVIDAPSIYVHRNQKGGIYALELIDGATIKRVITPQGRTPLPPEPAYQQMLKGITAINYTTQELIYAPRNGRTHKLYGYSPVEQVIMTVNIALRRQLHQLQYYTEGNIPEAIVGLPDMQPKQVKEFQQYWDGLFEGNTAMRRHSKFVPGEMKIQFTKDPVLKDEYDEWLARVICYAFSLPPTAFVRQMNRSTADSAKEMAMEEGLAPLMQWVKELVDRVLALCFGYHDLEFIWQDVKDTDPLITAQINQIYVSSGIKMVNEVRKELGLELLPEDPDTTPVSDDILPEPTQDSPEGNREKRQKPKIIPINRNRPLVRKSVRGMTQALTRVFHQEKRALIDTIIAAYSAFDKTESENKAEVIVETLDLEGFTAIVGVVRSPLRLISKDGGNRALEQLDISDPTVADLVEEKAAGIGDYRAAELVGKRWVKGKLIDNPNAKWTIHDVTRDLLRTDIDRAMQEGWSTERLAGVLEENYAFSSARAETIARTEIAKADMHGSMIAYRESGVVEGKEWLLADDPCPICEANASQGAIPLDEVFDSGDDAAPAHPNCQCTVSPVVTPLKTEEEA